MDNFKDKRYLANYIYSILLNKCKEDPTSKHMVALRLQGQCLSGEAILQAELNEQKGINEKLTAELGQERTAAVMLKDSVLRLGRDLTHERNTVTMVLGAQKKRIVELENALTVTESKYREAIEKLGEMTVRHNETVKALTVSKVVSDNRGQQLSAAALEHAQLRAELREQVAQVAFFQTKYSACSYIKMEQQIADLTAKLKAANALSNERGHQLCAAALEHARLNAKLAELANPVVKANTFVADAIASMIEKVKADANPDFYKTVSDSTGLPRKTCKSRIFAESYGSGQDKAAAGAPEPTKQDVADVAIKAAEALTACRAELKKIWEATR